MGDHKAPTLPDSLQLLAGSRTLQLHLEGQTTRINPTKIVPINLPTSSYTPLPFNSLQTAKHKLQASTLLKLTPSKKLNTCKLLASRISQGAETQSFPLVVVEELPSLLEA
ncbi:hypothetical protein ACTXT7_014630 [Hymenolepis weldensis]